MTTCIGCGHYSFKRAGEMAKHGSGVFDRQPDYVYHGPSHSCGEFTPAPADDVAKRRAWYIEKFPHSVGVNP